MYLRAKFEVFSIILTSFRQGGKFTPLPPPQNEPLKSPSRVGLKKHTTVPYRYNFKYQVYAWSKCFHAAGISYYMLLFPWKLRWIVLFFEIALLHSISQFFSVTVFIFLFAQNSRYYVRLPQSTRQSCNYLWRVVYRPL